MYYSIMKKNNTAKLIFIICFFTLAFSCGGKVEAEVAKLPDMVVGQTTVYSGGRNQYGGMGGNYAIFNQNAGETYGLDFSVLGLTGGCQNNLITEPSCYKFGNYASPLNFSEIGGRMLRARTYVTDLTGNRQLVLETPALFYGKNFIIGDVSAGNVINNLNLWGKNLAQSGGSIDSNVGAAWSLQGYKVNDKSQSAWNDAAESDKNSEFSKFSDKVGTLFANATVIAASELELANSPLYLQNNTNNIKTAGADTAKYPEGKVWLVQGSVSIPANMTIKYSGIGTLIIKGNFFVGTGVKIIPMDPTKDKLGIIVLE